MLRGGIPFSNAPGVAYEYSNYGFAILGRIVANVSEMTYGDYVAANILKPLGMTSTTLEPADVLPARLAHGYRWEDERWKDEPLLANGSFGSMGGMLTSVRDLGRYVGAFLAAWPPRDGPETAPIRRSSLREMQQIWRPGPASVARDPSGAMQLNSGGYGFGLRISQTCAFRHIVAHSGGLPGFGSVMRWLPEYGVGFIAFGNLTYTGWGRVTTNVFDALVRTGALQPRRRSRRRRWSRRATRCRSSSSAGTTAADEHRGRQSVSRSDEGAAPRRDRRAPRKVGACTPGHRVRLGRERLARRVDDELRAREAAGGDHARADDAPTVQYLEVRPAPTCRREPTLAHDNW